MMIGHMEQGELQNSSQNVFIQSTTADTYWDVNTIWNLVEYSPFPFNLEYSNILFNHFCF